MKLTLLYDSFFKAHWNLLITVGEYMLSEQAREYYGITEDGPPTMHAPVDVGNMSKEEKITAMETMLDNFVGHHHYGQFSLQAQQNEEPVANPPAPVVYTVVGGSDGNIYLIPSAAVSSPITSSPDDMRAYSSRLCHWVLHLLELDDTAHEGDMQRLIANCKYNLMFLFSHSKLSKYFVENLDFLLKVEQLLSPSQQMRVLEGSFINMSGGRGNNVEADLVQEHSVRNQKDLIRKLGSNKTELAISRVTNGADTIAAITKKMDFSINNRVPGARHTNHISETDNQKVLNDMICLYI